MTTSGCIQQSEEDEGVDTTTGQGLKAADDDEDMDEHSDPDYLPESEIDAFWLQREVGKFYDDAETAQQKTDEILSILAKKDDREVENQLLTLPGSEKKFDLLKKLLKNRFRVCVNV